MSQSHFQPVSYMNLVNSFQAANSQPIGMAFAQQTGFTQVRDSRENLFASNLMPLPPKFAFSERIGRINWRALMNTDLDKIQKEVDLKSLEGLLQNITFAQLDRDDLERLGDAHFIKLFRLTQYSIEYLLYTQNYMESLCKALDIEYKQSYERTVKTEEVIKKYQQELKLMRKELKLKQKTLSTYEYLMKLPVEQEQDVIKCRHCPREKPKFFLNKNYLYKHYQRNHPEVDFNREFSDMPNDQQDYQNSINERTLQTTLEKQQQQQKIDQEQLFEKIKRDLFVNLTENFKTLEKELNTLKDKANYQQIQELLQNFESKNEQEQRKLQDQLNRPAKMLEDLKQKWADMFQQQGVSMKDMIAQSVTEALSKRKEDRDKKKMNQTKNSDNSQERNEKSQIQEQKIKFFEQRINEFDEKFQENEKMKQALEQKVNEYEKMLQEKAQAEKKLAAKLEQEEKKRKEEERLRQEREDEIIEMERKTNEEVMKKIYEEQKKIRQEAEQKYQEMKQLEENKRQELLQKLGEEQQKKIKQEQDEQEKRERELKAKQLEEEKKAEMERLAKEEQEKKNKEEQDRQLKLKQEQEELKKKQQEEEQERMRKQKEEEEKQKKFEDEEEIEIVEEEEESEDDEEEIKEQQPKKSPEDQKKQESIVTEAAPSALSLRQRISKSIKQEFEKNNIYEGVNAHIRSMFSHNPKEIEKNKDTLQIENMVKQEEILVGQMQALKIQRVPEKSNQISTSRREELKHVNEDLKGLSSKEIDRINNSLIKMLNDQSYAPYSALIDDFLSKALK